MDTYISAPLFSIGLFLGMVVFVEIGRYFGTIRLEKYGGTSGFGAVEGAILALFGLLVAFLFGGAASRFDSRRALIAEEANAIGTAYLRLDVLASEDQPELRDLFRRYVDSRLEVYRRLPDIQAALTELNKSTDLQKMIWERGLAAARGPNAYGNAPMLLMPALNTMFDITTTRTMATRTHSPPMIYWLLFLLSLGCAFLAGHGMAFVKPRSWFHAIGFAVIVSIAVFVILALEYPRAGLINESVYDQVLLNSEKP